MVEKAKIMMNVDATSNNKNFAIYGKYDIPEKLFFFFGCCKRNLGTRFENLLFLEPQQEHKRAEFFLLQLHWPSPDQSII